MGTLKVNVNVQNTWYGPAHGNADEVPEDVASQIANPDAWEAEEKPETAKVEAKPERQSRRSQS